MRARTPSTRITRLTTIARTGRLMKRSVKFMVGRLLLGRGRRRIVGQLHRIVDDHRRSALLLALPGRYHDVPLANTLQYGDLVAAGLAEHHKALIGDKRVLALHVP